jgi:hypothetical protein
MIFNMIDVYIPSFISKNVCMTLKFISIFQQQFPLGLKFLKKHTKGTTRPQNHTEGTKISLNALTPTKVSKYKKRYTNTATISILDLYPTTLQPPPPPHTSSPPPHTLPLPPPHTHHYHHLHHISQHWMLTLAIQSSTNILLHHSTSSLILTLTLLLSLLLTLPMSTTSLPFHMGTFKSSLSPLIKSVDDILPTIIRDDMSNKLVEVS